MRMVVILPDSAIPCYGLTSPLGSLSPLPRAARDRHG